MKFYIFHYKSRSLKRIVTMQIPADNVDEAIEYFYEYWEDEDLPTPKVNRITIENSAGKLLKDQS